MALHFLQNLPIIDANLKHMVLWGVFFFLYILIGHLSKEKDALQQAV